MTAKDVVDALDEYAKPDDAVFLQRFFKTGAGQYGEGDIFIGVRVPQTRQICKNYKDLPLPEVQKLLNSEVHEQRLAALIIITYQYPKADQAGKQRLYNFYLKNVQAGRVNNWDLVDLSAPLIVGVHLQERPRDILFTLARNENLWQRRVAIISTFAFLRTGDPSTTLDIAEILLYDTHDLIQKAVGWMLRELGKRVDRQLLLQFLDEHAHDMPRTTLRYAIEHLPPDQKTHYMARKVAAGR